MRERAAGVLLHLTSLPGGFGAGDLGPSASSFLDWMESAGQKLWPFLPLGPVGFGDSPYGGLSAFAGNPLFISPERLHEDGLLDAAALEGAPAFSTASVDYAGILEWRRRVLRTSWVAFQRGASKALRDELLSFVFGPEQAYWLEDWGLFAALARRFDTTDWTTWDADLAARDPGAVARARAELADEVDYQEFLQFLFFRQWEVLRRDAARRGIALFGDVPMYPALGSADVWAHRGLFDLDAHGRPVAVAGVPPDYFSDEGQRWGNPLFRWDRIEEDGWRWWIERLRANFRVADVVRLDHFRGFAAYWRVPAEEESAAAGTWVEGPGMGFFRALRGALGDARIVAEDLGVITDDVRALLAETGFPGMRVLQFAWGGRDDEAQPHRHEPNAVVYTGTHDNDTTAGWWETAGEAERRRVREYLRVEPATGAEMAREMTRAAYLSVSDVAIAPAQDLLGLGSDHRMNVPGRSGGNWRWRLAPGRLDDALARDLRRLAELSGRASPAP